MRTFAFIEPYEITISIGQKWSTTGTVFNLR